MKDKHTPWGEYQTIEELPTPDCFAVTTAGHGGFIVPIDIAESRIPQVVLNKLFASPGRYLGKYCYAFEEDCDVCVFLAWFPESIHPKLRTKFISSELPSYCEEGGMLAQYNPELKEQSDALCASRIMWVTA